MRAICWNGVNDISTETVNDPAIATPHDAILKVRLSTTCGSDLHFIDGYIPTMREGDVIGHEFMGEIVEVGPEVQRLKAGERVVIVRQHEPEPGDADPGPGPAHRRDLRLHPRLRRLRRLARGVHAARPRRPELLPRAGERR